MAVKTQAGADSILFWGRQEPGKVITAKPSNIPNIDTPEYTNAVEDGVGNIIHARFPFVSLGLDFQSEVIESRTITGSGSASKPIIGQIWADGPIEFEAIPRNLIHLLRPSFNIAPTPVNAPVVAYVRGADSGDIPAPMLGALDSVAGRLLTATKAPSDSTIGTRLSTPASLTITFAAALTTKARLTIRGSKRIGLPDGEIVPYTQHYDVEEDATTFKTPDYFDSWETIKLVKHPDSSDLEADDKLSTVSDYDTGVFKTVLPGFGEGLSEGVTFFGRKGFMPFLSNDGYFNNITFSISDAISITAEVLAGSYYENRQPDTGYEEKLSLDEGWLDKENYPVGELDFLPAWGSLFRFGDDIVDMTAVEMGINLNLEHRRGYRASRQRGKPRRSNTPRYVTLSPTTFFEHSKDADDMFNKWNEIYILKQSRAASYECYNWEDSGRQHSIVCKFPDLVLNEVPTNTVDGAQEIEQTLSFLSVSTSGSNDAIVEVISDKYYE